MALRICSWLPMGSEKQGPPVVFEPVLTGGRWPGWAAASEDVDGSNTRANWHKLGLESRKRFLKKVLVYLHTIWQGAWHENDAAGFACCVSVRLQSD